jgi:hypothetical protein
MTVTGESRRQVMARLLAEGGYDWAAGEDLSWTPGAAEAERNKRRMEERYRAWAEAQIITYTPGKYESACRTYKNMPFETINPVDDTVALPEPRYDEKLKKWVVPKNVFDKNVLSRRRFLYEIDGLSLEEQKDLLEPLLKEKVIQRVVFSGNKSLHCVVEEEDEPEKSADDEEYKWCWRYLAYKFFRDLRFRDLSLPVRIDNSFLEVVDNRCGHPSRTTRAPFGVRRDEATGGRPVEQKLLYFAPGRVDSGWRAVYRKMKEREEAEREQARRRARRQAWQNRDREKKTPNAAALRFIGGDMSDGWKHASLGSAVASFKACGYGRDEVMRIFEPYSKELRIFASHAWEYFERKDRR